MEAKKKKNQVPVAIVYLSALIIFLILFGIIGYLAVKDFVPGAQAEELDAQEDDSVSYSQNDSMTILYTVANSQNDLLSIVVARFMPSSQQIVIIPLTPYAEYDGRTLGSIYSSSGIADMSDKAGELLGIKIDKYMTMTDSTFAEIINTMGSAIVTLVDNVAIYDKGEDDYTYYNRGDRLAADGYTAVALISYTDYSGGFATNMKLSGEIAAAITNNFFSHTESAKSNIDSIFRKQYSDANTNMSTDEYNRMKSAIIYVIENSTSPSYSLTPTGGWTEDGMFVIDSAFISQLDGYFQS